MKAPARLAALFAYDFDLASLAALAPRFEFDRAGFDLFSFPSNIGLVGFDLERFADRQARLGRRRGWAGVLSAQEQFGALAAALVAERLGLPGTRPEAVIAAQHKLHARAVLEQVAPEANLRYSPLEARYGGPVPEGLSYPVFVKPVKAAFSVLAREVASRAELHRHTRFGRRELWIIRHLVEPFERVARARLPAAGSAHRMMLEEPLPAATPQYNLDGWVFDGRVHLLGVVDAVMHPGTNAFMRWELPSRLDAAVQQRALDVARRFLGAIGFTHGFFNLEFFHDPATDRLAVIEFNPRLASQFSDLYRRVLGADPFEMLATLSVGDDPLRLARHAPTAGAAASLVYRCFPGEPRPAMPDAARRDALMAQFDDALLFTFAKSGRSIERDFKWLGSWRHGDLHLGGRDRADLRDRAERASALLGWRAPYREPHDTPFPQASTLPDARDQAAEGASLQGAQR